MALSPRLLPELSLSEDEAAFFMKRNAYLRPGRVFVGVNKVSPGWLFISLRAATKAWRSRSTKCAFIGSLAVMDHSDRGIEKLLQSAGLQASEMSKRRLPASLRFRAARIAFITANRNQRRFRALDTTSHTSVTTSRYLAGAVVFAQLLAIASAQPTMWRGTFLSGDVSFLRMFAAFASSRTGRPLFIMMNDHGEFAEGSFPFEAVVLFSWNSADVAAFMVPPQHLCLLQRVHRRRAVPADGPLEVGLVLQNYADLERVEQFAQMVSQHPEVKSVLIRPHPGDLRLPDAEPSVELVRFAPSSQSLEEFSEAIDFAVVQGSSAIDHLVGLGVPCFGTGRLSSPPADWGLIQGSPNFRASIPAFPESVDEAIQQVRNTEINLHPRESEVGPGTGMTPSGQIGQTRLQVALELVVACT